MKLEELQSAISTYESEKKSNSKKDSRQIIWLKAFVFFSPLMHSRKADDEVYWDEFEAFVNKVRAHFQNTDQEAELTALVQNQYPEEYTNLFQSSDDFNVLFGTRFMSHDRGSAHLIKQFYNNAKRPVDEKAPELSTQASPIQEGKKQSPKSPEQTPEIPPLDEIKQKVTELVGQYTSFYKLSILGHKHEHRARFVIDSVNKATSYQEIHEILVQQQKLLSGQDGKVSQFQPDKNNERFTLLKHVHHTDYTAEPGSFLAILTDAINKITVPAINMIESQSDKTKPKSFQPT